MGLLEGERALVTGAAHGIGAATARAMVAEGAQVAVLDRDADGAQRVADEIGGIAVVVDVADPVALREAFDQAAGGLGGLTVVFNNAGVGNLKPLHTYTPAEVDLLVDVNFTGSFHGVAAAIPHLRASGGGAIVNMASVSGLRPTRGEAPYSAAKAAVIALTRSAALEYGPDAIRVNCVSPGFIRTDLTGFAFDNPAWIGPIEAATPLARAGTSEDVADVVVFLASSRARYVTGQNLVVDGGSMLPSSQVDGFLREMLGE